METDSGRLKHLPLWLGIGAFVLYVLTGARTIQWQDSAQFTYRIATGTQENVYGLAMVHPLHFMLGCCAALLFPHHLPWALSGVSALGGALAVGLTTAAVTRLTHNTLAALYAGLSLLLAHTFWRFSCLPEVYTWSAALMMGQILLYIRSKDSQSSTHWIWIFALNGIALSNHNLALLTLAVWGIRFLLECRNTPGLIRQLPLMGVAWLMGTLPFSLLILQEGLHSGDWQQTIHSALFGHGFREQVSGLFPKPAFSAISIAFLLLSFPGLALFFSYLTWKNRRTARRSFPGVLFAIAAIHLLFFLRYNVIDQYTFLVPVFPLIALFSGAGFALCPKPNLKKAAWICLLIQVPLYGITPAVARATGILQPFARNKPFRDDAEYLFWPWRFQDTSGDQLSRAAFEAAKPNGIVVYADPMVEHTLRWQRREQELERDIELLRAERHEEMLEALKSNQRLIWVPLRTTDPIPGGWQERGGVWIAETNPIAPSTSE